jgi:hypothetical protein
LRGVGSLVSPLKRTGLSKPVVWTGDILWLVEGRKMKGVVMDDALRHIALQKAVSAAESKPLRCVFFRPAKTP